MERSFQTWSGFRRAVEDVSRESLPDHFWDMLKETLSWASIHEPYSEGDIPFAVEQLKSLKRFMSFPTANSMAGTCSSR